jgi:hypothetical protein
MLEIAVAVFAEMLENWKPSTVDVAYPWKSKPYIKFQA